MNIYATKGHRVVFHNNGGYANQREYAAKILQLGHTYTVDHTDVHQSSTTVYLEEFPDHSFNSVQFDDAVPDAP